MPKAPKSRHGASARAVRAAVTALVLLPVSAPGSLMSQHPSDTVRLPAPALEGQVSVEAAVTARRSVRGFQPTSLSAEQAGQLLWAAQGVTGPDGRRSAPSAGATYPLDMLAVVGCVDGIPPGIYRYRPAEHALERLTSGDRRADVVGAASTGNAWMAEAPLILAFVGVTERTARRYGERAPRYVHIEVGAAAENAALEAVALGLGTTFIGAFDDARMGPALGVGPGEEVVLLLPVGVPR